MRSLSRFGSYGFLSALVAAQIAFAPSLFADDLKDKADRAGTDVKKSARDVKRDAKKAGRKVTGQDSAWEDLKDETSDAGKDIKDEAGYSKRKLKRKLGE